MHEQHLANFWRRVVKADGDDCWAWNGAHHDGYAESWDGVQPIAAHRIMYMLNYGPVPKGLVIDHICNNRGCVNPAHLRAVTHRVNILRGKGTSAVHALKTHCPQGHPYDDENTYFENKGNGRRGRRCRTCNAARCRAAHLIRKAKRPPKEPRRPQPCLECGEMFKNLGPHRYFRHKPQ